MLFASSQLARCTSTKPRDAMSGNNLSMPGFGSHKTVSSQTTFLSEFNHAKIPKLSVVKVILGGKCTRLAKTLVCPTGAERGVEINTPNQAEA
jgi:hypothetical protein